MAWSSVLVMKHHFAEVGLRHFEYDACPSSNSSLEIGITVACIEACSFIAVSCVVHFIALIGERRVLGVLNVAVVGQSCSTAPVWK